MSLKIRAMRLKRSIKMLPKKIKILFRKIPLNMVIAYGSLITTLVLIAGTIYAALNANTFFRGLLYPSINGEFAAEAIAATFFIILGISGLELLRRCAAHIYSPMYARTLVMIGIILILIAFFGLEWLLFAKAPYIFK